MKIIKPSEVSGSILTLLDESNERVILVSPYIKISKWFKFINKIKELENRKIMPKIYVRDDPENTATFRDLDHLELNYTKIPHLHCKLYMNERFGIISSMNLLLSSEINSLEIGYATETWTEYNELLAFYHRYIQTDELANRDAIDNPPFANQKKVVYGIKKELERTVKSAWLWFAGNALHISTGLNNYSISINDGYLIITAFLKINSTTNRKLVQNSSLIAKKIGDLTTMKVNAHTGTKLDYLQLSGQVQNIFKSPCINNILEAESDYMVESVLKYINTLENLR
jgi:hypothetical protein